MTSTNFGYRDEINAYAYAAQLTHHMKWPTPRNLILSSPELFWEHDEDLFRSIVNAMAVDNCQIYVLGKDLDKLDIPGTWEKEKWFGAEYKTMKLNEELYHKVKSYPYNLTYSNQSSCAYSLVRRIFLAFTCQILASCFRTSLTHSVLLHQYVHFL